MNDDDYKKRHAKAWGIPHPGFESAFRAMLCGLADYAKAHRDRFESPIGEDYVLGPAWLDALKGVRALLNGELGRLDGGTLDRFILDLAKAHGFEEDSL